MFAKTWIISLDRNNISIHRVRYGKNTIISTQDFSEENLKKILTELKNKYRLKKIRFLLSDDISYIGNLPIPDDIDQKNHRSYIQKYISENIPDNLNSQDWDYCISGLDPKQATIFAPIKNISTIIENSLISSGLVTDLIQPSSIAIQTNPDPVIAVANQKNIKGSDDKILNINFDYLQSDADNQPLKKSKINSKPIFVYLLLTLIITIPIFFISSYFAKSKNTSSSDNLSNQTETIIPTNPITPTTTNQNKQNIKINILNGSGLAGLASTSQEFFESIGYTDIDTGNADNYDYQQNELYLKDNIDKDIFLKEIQNGYDIDPQNILPLDKDSTYDVIFILGQQAID